ncbi:MAG: DNA repair protein RecN [Saprospiraceae bacterium]|nr:DNA repair protein RecN [Saprospiraceae bacterium]
MIQSLKIENYAIIESVEIQFDKGLNIITGETGAGKSILLGALGLIMGQRADTKVLYDQERKCIVEAAYLNYPKAINTLLEEEDYDVDEVLTIRREIVPSGKSRAFVNDTPAKLDLLQRLTNELIDLNQQFEITQIRERDYQLQIIDALAKNESLRAEYKGLYNSYTHKKKELEELVSAESHQLKELDFIRFQYNELAEAEPLADELQSLESESSTLAKVDEINLLLEETNYLLFDSENAIKDQLSEIQRKWSELIDTHPKIADGAEQLNNLIESLSELGFLKNEIESTLNTDPQRLQEINDRLDVLYRLHRKHSVSDNSALIQIMDNLKDNLDAYENRDQHIAQLKSEIESLHKELTIKASTLSQNRQKVFKILEKAVSKKLEALSMESASISVDCKESQTLRSDGKDEIQILFKSNKGGQFLPIKNVASGGESSRLMLAIKSTIADAMELPTMIFDEIDTGVSGEVAGRMGNILKQLSKQHQLICITHSPQVSARANNHYLVHKFDSKNRTYTHVKLLSGDERITEIAKMLSGDPPSAFALDNAKDLIQQQNI